MYQIVICNSNCGKFILLANKFRAYHVIGNTNTLKFSNLQEKFVPVKEI